MLFFFLTQTDESKRVVTMTEHEPFRRRHHSKSQFNQRVCISYFHLIVLTKGPFVYAGRFWAVPSSSISGRFRSNTILSVFILRRLRNGQLTRLVRSGGSGVKTALFSFTCVEGRGRVLYGNTI